MTADAELLNFIYQNSQMGIESISQFIDMCDNEKFKTLLSEELNEYVKINDVAKDLLHVNGYNEKGINAFGKISTYLMINIKTLTDKSASHMAKMLIEGSNKGIIDATKKLNEYEGSACADIVNLMIKLRQLEEKNVEKYKQYL